MMIPLLENALLLAAAPGRPPGGLMDAIGGFLPIILIFVIFYFLLIRPQMKKQKEHQRMVGQLKTGDVIITSGGIHGIISNVKETTVIVKIAENTKVELDRNSVGVVLKKGDEVAA